MGKPFALELDKLVDTYRWACEVSIQPLRSFVAVAEGRPLVTVGSGGSLTAARMASLLHESRGSIARSVTPYELLAVRDCLYNSSVLILTAGGHNPDIRNAFKFAAIAEPLQLAALCMTMSSPLRELAETFGYSQLFEYDNASGKDGFLATNSLLALVTLLIRAYQDGNDQETSLPADLVAFPGAYHHLKDLVQPLLNRETWLVLYGGWGCPPALDIESKFSEAALGNIQLADYRNFAHGRHHWLAKRGSQSGVLALVGSEETDIARRTLRLLPREIPVAQLVTDRRGPMGALDLLVQVLYLTYFVGNARGIDPGKPGVPAFGSRIYRMQTQMDSHHLSSPHALSNRARVAISRKLGHVSLTRIEGHIIAGWRQAYHQFVNKLERTRFGTVVFDYDGTLCRPGERYTGASVEVGRELERLLRSGILVGIATGRGKSVREDLQRQVPNELWNQVLIGYYNGSDIAPLWDTSHPEVSKPPAAELQTIRSLLDKHPDFSRIARFDYRPGQITVEALSPSLGQLTRNIILDTVLKSASSAVQVLESSHSFDILAPGVSKLRLVTACQEALAASGDSGAVLCVGDRGKWPGNDYDLLSTAYSLSVDTVSTDAESCWNLSAAGQRGVQATLMYLRSMAVEAGGFYFRLTERK